MMPTQEAQQINGKTHSEGLQPLTPFDPGNPSAHYTAEPAPMMYHHHLPDPIVQAPPPVHYPLEPVSFHHHIEPLSVQKDSMFDMENPPTAVPANIIQQQQQPEMEPMTIPEAVTEKTSIAQPETIQSPPNSSPTESSPAIPPQQQTSPEELPSPEKPQQSVFSPEQNNMMKALGVVRKEVLAPISGSNKRRRRILQLNEDDSDDDSELKKEILQISPEKEKEKAENESEESESDGEKDPEAFKARSLLKSAVIIHGPASKKKKRVLESDEEDEMQTSVDDIGLMGETNEDDEMYSEDIIVSDAVFDTTEKVIPIENPIIIVQDEFAVPAPPSPLKNEDLKEVEAEKSPKAIVKSEKVERQSEEGERIIKPEEGEAEIDPSMSVEAILENIKPMADDE